jgi:hypothetical protein
MLLIHSRLAAQDFLASTRFFPPSTGVLPSRYIVFPSKYNAFLGSTIHFPSRYNVPTSRFRLVLFLPSTIELSFEVQPDEFSGNRLNKVRISSIAIHHCCIPGVLNPRVVAIALSSLVSPAVVPGPVVRPSRAGVAPTTPVPGDSSRFSCRGCRDFPSGQFLRLPH